MECILEKIKILISYMDVNGDIKADAYYFCVSGHEAVDVVVDLLEDKSSVHEGKTALVKTNNA